MLRGGLPLAQGQARVRGSADLRRAPAGDAGCAAFARSGVRRNRPGLRCAAAKFRHGDQFCLLTVAEGFCSLSGAGGMTSAPLEPQAESDTHMQSRMAVAAARMDQY